jgi:hypothetical protein
MDIIVCPVFHLKLNSTHLNSIRLFVLHRKHTIFLLRAQQVNVICRFVTMVYHNSIHYPSSYLLFKTQSFGDFILSSLCLQLYLLAKVSTFCPSSGDRLALSIGFNRVCSPSEDGDRIKSPKRCVSNKREDLKVS